MIYRTPTVFLGICAEGMGHVTRALPLVAGLRREGYRVEVFGGGRVARLLRERGEPVNDIPFIPLFYEGNRVDVVRSMWFSLKRAHLFLLAGLGLLFRVLRERPVAIVTDAEPVLAWVGWLTRTPVVSVDNNHLLCFAELPCPRDEEEERAKRVAARALSWVTPFPRRVLLTSFFRPPLLSWVDKDKVGYAPCAVRPEVLARRESAHTEGAVLVYQTSPSNTRLARALAEAAARSQLSFVVYGGGHEGTAANGRVRYRSFSEEGFLDDLAAAPFVIVNGGHSTIVEALALGKPVLSEPIEQHYEQRTNAVGLELLGVGRATDWLDEHVILELAAQLPAMRARIGALDVVDNDGLVREVHRALVEVSPRAALVSLVTVEQPSRRIPSC